MSSEVQLGSCEKETEMFVADTRTFTRRCSSQEPSKTGQRKHLLLNLEQVNVAEFL